MNLLLDTHVFIWMMTDDSRISPTAKAALADLGNDLWLSAASVWELSIKSAIGKLVFADPLPVFVSEGLIKARASELPVSIRHALQVATMPLHHNDPFDRLLAAQAKVESMALVTVDAKLVPYGVPIVW
jgi:PIN domain nuclease of toxin-antitoxin system